MCEEKLLNADRQRDLAHETSVEPTLLEQAGNGFLEDADISAHIEWLTDDDPRASIVRFCYGTDREPR